MASLQRAREEWEANTTPLPKQHRVSGFRMAFRTHEFRQFGQAIAWLEWDGKYGDLKKLEKLPGAKRGAGTLLLQFLKSLADKHQIRLFGNATVHEPDPPIPDGPLLSQEQLESWYKKHGFQLCRTVRSDIVEIWYPGVPPRSSDVCQ